MRIARGMFTAALLVAAAAATACGKSEDRQRQEAAEAAAKQLEDAASSLESGDTAKGLAEMGKALGALASGGTTDGKPVDPVSFRDLQTLFPEVSGWERETPRGQRMTSPVPFSEATTSYRQGDASIELQITDSGFNQLLVGPLAMFLQAGFESETDTGYEKATKVGSFPGWEKWESDSNRGELSALVGKRFIVSIEGDGISDTKVLHDFASKLDLRKLEAMK
jgi:hypothetical protein